MKLIRALAIRLGIFAASLIVASVVVFALLNLLPGDVAQVILGSGATPETVSRMRAELGLDEPLVLRYWDWATGIFHGDLGVSAFTHEPIAPIIAQKLGVTLGLVICGMVLAIAIALPIGILAAEKRKKPSGAVISAASQLGMAVPAFLAGILLSIGFAVKLQWLPANGYTPFTADPLDWARRMVLPAASLALVQASVLIRYVRGAFLDVLQEDYYRTARSIGWRRHQALIRHGMRNAALQLTTVLGLQLTTLFVGAIVIEQVFVLPGLGSLLLNSVSSRDLPLVQGIVMLLVTLILVVNALVDAAYLVIDPRLRNRNGGR